MTTTTIYPRPWRPSPREKLEQDWLEEKERMGDLIRAVSFFERLEGKPGPRLPPETQAPLVQAILTAIEAVDPQGFEVAVTRWKEAWDLQIDKFIGTEEAQAATKRRTPRP